MNTDSFPPTRAAAPGKAGAPTTGRTRRSALLLLMAAAAWLTAAGTAQAAPADLDPTFSPPDGKLVEDFGFSSFSRDVIVQPDGKLVVGVGLGDPQAAAAAFHVARYNSDGSPDTSFSGDGRASIDFDEDDPPPPPVCDPNQGGNPAACRANEQLASVALQADGKIVAVGSVNANPAEVMGPESNDFGIARLNPNGTPDTGFSGDGRLRYDFSVNPSFDFPDSVSIASDGKIVVAGEAGGGAAAARFTSSGGIDASFANAGELVLSGSDPLQQLDDVLVQPDSKILLAGNKSGPSSEPALARRTETGAPDTTFSQDGFLSSPGITGFQALALQVDGRIVAAGGGGVARFQADGTPDTTLGGSGVVTTSQFALDVALEPDNDIVLSASADSSPSGDQGDFWIARYKANGSPDPSFGGDGEVTTDFGADDYAEAVALQPDGKIVTSGRRTVPMMSRSDVALARYQGGEGLGLDSDGDGVPDESDNCPSSPNPDQLDSDGDGQGDVCDSDGDDGDGDGVPDDQDNCPSVSNSSQTNTDSDTQGDACDADDDNDGVADGPDNCPVNANSGQTDTDADGQGDACDADDDNDGKADTSDGCPLQAAATADGCPATTGGGNTGGGNTGGGNTGGGNTGGGSSGDPLEGCPVTTLTGPGTPLSNQIWEFPLAPGGRGSYRPIGQTFKVPADSILTAVELSVVRWRANYPDGPIELVVGSGSNPASGGQVITNPGFPDRPLDPGDPNIYLGHSEWVKFDVRIPLLGGQTYNFSVAGAPRYSVFGLSNPYPSGTLLTREGAWGTDPGKDLAFRVLGCDPTAPRFVGTPSATPGTFAVNPAGRAERPVVGSAVKRGTTFRYRLSEKATTTFVIQRKGSGRRVIQRKGMVLVGEKCNARTKKNARRKRCVRYTRVGAFRHRGKAGVNRKRFTGRIGRKRLKPGRYRAVLRAVDSEGKRSAPRVVKFRVVGGQAQVAARR